MKISLRVGDEPLTKLSNANDEADEFIAWGGIAAAFDAYPPRRARQ